MRLCPAERLQQCINLTKFMNNKKDKLFELENSPLEIEAMIVDKPEIIMNPDRKMEFRGDMMTINQNTKLYESYNLDDILYIYPDNLRFMIEKIDDHLVEIG